MFLLVPARSVWTDWLMLTLLLQLIHSLQRKKTMFENVNIDWHLTHDEGSTDFSDDEMLDDHHQHRQNGARTPTEHMMLLSTSASNSPDKSDNSASTSSTSPSRRPLSVFTPSKLLGKSPEWNVDSHNRAVMSSSSSRVTSMPPPPPPSGKKPSLCKSI